MSPGPERGINGLVVVGSADIDAQIARAEFDIFVAADVFDRQIAGCHANVEIGCVRDLDGELESPVAWPVGGDAEIVAADIGARSNLPQRLCVSDAPVDTDARLGAADD